MGIGGLLLFISLLIIIFCELWYVDNNFPSPGERQNTIFRFHYAAGIFLSLSACAFWPKGRKTKNIRVFVWIILLFFWIFGSIIPGFARLVSEKGAWTMDVRLALDPKREGLIEASEWLFENTPPHTVIAESGGQPYRLFATVSAMSGRIAVLGEMDKVQNHGIDISRMMLQYAKLNFVYQDIPEARDVIIEFFIDYIIVSPREEAAFPKAKISSLKARYPVVFKCEKTSILKIEWDNIGQTEKKTGHFE